MSSSYFSGSIFLGGRDMEVPDKNGKRARMVADIMDIPRSASGFSFFFPGENLSGCSRQFFQHRAQENRKFLNEVF